MAISAQLRSISIDETLQPRIGGLDEEHVKTLQGVSDSWPPLVVVRWKGGYLLLDGFHRLAAAQNLGLETVPLDVVELPSDGDLHSLAFALNARHGRPLTLADRRAFAQRLLQLHTEWADREIGRQCGLSSNTVGAIRETLERAAQIEQTPVRVGAGGYQYTVGTNERHRQRGELPEPNPVDVIGGLVDKLVTPETRIRQRKIAHYLQRLSIALEEQDALDGWDTAQDAAQSLRVVFGEERAKQLGDSLGYSSRQILDVAISLGYEDEE